MKGEKLMAQRILYDTDKNGTKYYHCSDRCGKCGGRGIISYYVQINGGECFDCGGSGIVQWEEKEYTPEYEQKLEEKRRKRFERKKAKAMALAPEMNAEFFEKNGFNSEGKTYFVLGKTFEIKDELKAQGAKWDGMSSHWHMAEKPEGREVLEISVDEMYNADYAGIYHWNSNIRVDWSDKYEVKNSYVGKIQDAEDNLKSQNSTSAHVGQVGEKIEAVVTYIHRASWESSYGYNKTTFLHTFKDESGNIFTWKTSTFIDSEYGTKLSLKATVKEHSEYKGIPQTVLTRCKIEEGE